MYLVELRPGKEELYRSVDELATAIRSGEVDTHSRIFHRATSKWISITLHPQFKAIAAAKESDASAPQPSWTFFTSGAEELEQTREPDASEDRPDPRLSSPAESATEENAPAAWRRPVSLGLAGLLLIVSVQLAFSAPWPAGSAFNRGLALVMPQADQRLESEAEPASSVVSLASTSAGWEVAYPSASVAEPAVQRAPVEVARVSAGRPAKGGASRPAVGAVGPAVEGMAVDTLIRQYHAAFAEARARLEGEASPAQLGRLLMLTRLTADSVAQLRLEVAKVRSAVETYRVRAVLIEQSHQDTFAVLSRQGNWPAKQILRWYARPSHKEAPALAMRMDSLLASIDGVLRVLEANRGAYEVTGASLTFDRQEILAEYRRLRGQVERQLDSARADGASSGVMPALIDAMGAVGLPEGSASM